MSSLGFWSIAAADPQRMTLVEPDGAEHTAGDLLASANQLVHGLRAIGLAPGDVVAVLLPNGREFIDSADHGRQLQQIADEQNLHTAKRPAVLAYGTHHEIDRIEQIGA